MFFKKLKTYIHTEKKFKTHSNHIQNARDKEGHFTLTKRSIHQEDITILNEFFKFINLFWLCPHDLQVLRVQSLPSVSAMKAQNPNGLPGNLQ